MAYIEVDVDIDEFDTDDIMDELIERINREKKHGFKRNMSKGFSEEDRKDLLEALDVPADRVTESLADQMKRELLEEAFNKYSLNELEELLKLSPAM